jgi:CheY-like chemotaxis protein
VNGDRTFDGLLEFLAAEAAQVMRADRSTIFLLDAERNELWSRIALGMGQQVIRFPADRGIAGHVVRTGDLLNVPDPYADPRFNQAVDRQTGYRTRSILCAPIRARDRSTIGALQALNKLDGGPFTADDERLIERIGAQCGVAIQNALLYEQLKAAEQQGAEPKTASPKLLFANEDANLAIRVTELLGGEFQVLRALDGDDAVQKVEDERPDLVLLSLEMPGKSGFETCRAVRASAAGRETPIIIFSTSNCPEDVVHAFEAGANDYIVKPFTPAQLRAKTHTWLLRTGRRGA